MVNKKLEAAREKVQRFNRGREAKERAKAREKQKQQRRMKAKERAKAREKQKQQKRIEANEPEGLSEKAQASLHQGKKLTGDLGINQRVASATDKAGSMIEVPEDSSGNGGRAPTLPGMVDDDDAGSGGGPQIPDFGGGETEDREPMFPGFGPDDSADDSAPQLPAFGPVDEDRSRGGAPRLPGMVDDDDDDDNRPRLPF